MATEKRLIDANAFECVCVNGKSDDFCNGVLYVLDMIDAQPTVDAFPVDVFKLHHIIFDNEGVPEVKLQIGDRYFILRTDPVDVREVVHGRWIEDYVYAEDPHDRLRYKCSVCGRTEEYREPYCHCGAKMDGDGDDNKSNL